MNDQLLDLLDLSDKEYQVYRTLLRLGETTTGPLCDETDIPSSRIYTILSSLEKKGLVIYSKQKNAKHYQATSPDNLKELYQEKLDELTSYSQELDSEIDDLEHQEHEIDHESTIRTYEHMRGIKAAIRDTITRLDENDIYTIIGAPKSGNKRLNAYFQKMHELREQQGASFDITYSNDAAAFARERADETTDGEVHILPIDTSMEIVVTPDIVQLVFFDHPAAVIEIERQAAVDTFTNIQHQLKQASNKPRDQF